jgi:hypothetical protein
VIVEAVANWCEVRSWTRRKNGKTEKFVKEPRVFMFRAPGASMMVCTSIFFTFSQTDRQQTDRGENERVSWSEPARKKEIERCSVTESSSPV